MVDVLGAIGALELRSAEGSLLSSLALLFNSMPPFAAGAAIGREDRDEVVRDRLFE